MVVRALFLALLAVFAAPAVSAASTTVALTPVEDVSFPFSCSWGPDWEERCWRDDSLRLPIGGEPDKVWRAALRFSLAPIPADATILTARLDLWYDGTCLGPYASDVRCDGRSFTLDAHQLLSPDWYDEREPELAWPRVARSVLPAWSGSRWLSWDLTMLVEDWQYGIEENDGLMLKLADEQEWAGPGPKPPSSSFPTSSLRPRLTLVYDL
jgi:hypothetical protein